MKPIPYGRQQITQEDLDAVTQVLQSDFLTQGPRIDEFEQNFANYIGADYAIAVSNGTAALHLNALALGVKEDTKVITTPITFAASANCVRYCGGTVEFADIDPKNLLLDLNHVEDIIRKDPDAYSGIIPVDFAGYPVNMEDLKFIAEKYDCWILEDACHAPGAYFTDQNGKKQLCGNAAFADAAIFSFHPVKHIAAGEGGMITTNNQALYEKIKLLRSHGITKSPDLLQQNHGGWYYEMQELGYNYRITDFQCALANSQLSRAHEGVQKRNQIADIYSTALYELEIGLPNIPTDIFHAYHLYVIQLNDRKGLYDYLRDHQIFCQVHYIPVHLQPYYKTLGWKQGDLPNAEKYYNHCLSLPMYPSLSQQEQEYVIEHIRDFMQKKQ